jgi:hypothetical protein
METQPGLVGSRAGARTVGSGGPSAAIAAILRPGRNKRSMRPIPRQGSSPHWYRSARQENRELSPGRTTGHRCARPANREPFLLTARPGNQLLRQERARRAVAREAGSCGRGGDCGCGAGSGCCSRTRGCGAWLSATFEGRCRRAGQTLRDPQLQHSSISSKRMGQFSSKTAVRSASSIQGGTR